MYAVFGSCFMFVVFRLADVQTTLFETLTLKKTCKLMALLIKEYRRNPAQDVLSNHLQEACVKFGLLRCF